MDYFTYLKSMEYGIPNTPVYNYTDDVRAATIEPWPLEFGEKSVQYNLNKLITGIKNSIEHEREDEIFYTQLISMAPNNEDKEIIKKIKENEILHGRILRKIFNKLTGVVIPEMNSNTNTYMSNNNINENKTYIELLNEAFNGELGAIEKYRELMAYAPTRPINSMLFYILTDEIRHSLKYQNLIAKNMHNN